MTDTIYVLLLENHGQKNRGGFSAHGFVLANHRSCSLGQIYLLPTHLSYTSFWAGLGLLTGTMK